MNGCLVSGQRPAQEEAGLEGSVQGGCLQLNGAQTVFVARLEHLSTQHHCPPLLRRNAEANGLQDIRIADWSNEVAPFWGEVRHCCCCWCWWWWWPAPCTTLRLALSWPPLADSQNRLAPLLWTGSTRARRWSSLP
jgi:hypothetical protein